MKTYLTLALILILGSISCIQSPVADKTITTDIQETAAIEGSSFLVDTAVSKIVWIGTKINGSNSGNLKIIDGKIGVKDGKLASGIIVIDVASLSCSGLSAKEKHKMETHLKSADFFDVAHYPTADFSISKVEIFNPDIDISVLEGATHTLSGNLTLKGVTKNVRFPAKIQIDNQQLTATADFVINRTDWGMNYKGANNPQDWLIDKDVNIKLSIVSHN